MHSQIGEGQKKALLEAFVAASSLVSAERAIDLVVIGGTALVILGGTRKTADVDFVVTPQALQEIETAAEKDARFTKDPAGQWIYLCIGSGIEDSPKAHTTRGYIANLDELATMKAHSYINRAEENDLEDLVFILKRMELAGESFGVLNPEDEDVLAEVQEDLEWDTKSILMKLLSYATGKGEMV